MKDKDIRSLLLDGKREAKLRPAADFWADFRARAGIVDSGQACVRGASAPNRGEGQLATHRPSFITRRRVVAAAAAAALVVCAAIALTAFPARHGPAPAFNDIEFGPELKHNGVFVITDEPTEAKILWVLTEGV